MMKKILLVYPPFCTPASPPYSITYIYSFLKNNCDGNISVLDLNLEFHRFKFPEYQIEYKDNKNWYDYDKITKGYIELTRKTYSQNNKKVRNNKRPEFFKELLNKIKNEKPDIVAFSIVYSSQVFYAYSLIRELKEVKIVIGGPAISEKLVQSADKALDNEVELLNYIQDNNVKPNFETVLDFSIYNLNEYFTPQPVIPLKTSTTCPYKQCSFCNHFKNVPYKEFSLDLIKKTIIDSKQKYFFLIDDMIPTKRLLKIAEAFKPLNISWTCQLRPTKDLDYETLKKLKESGLVMIIWGVESGNNRILNLINKGTNKNDIKKVLEDSHNAGIKNVAYVLFGFPTETKEEFLETVEFLKTNEKNIDLISVSEFGLQKGTEVYNNPQKFGIKKIIEEKRTLLGPKIRYELKEGLTQEAVSNLIKKHRKTLDNINKYPRTMNFFREHMICSNS